MARHDLDHSGTFNSSERLNFLNTLKSVAIPALANVDEVLQFSRPYRTSIAHTWKNWMKLVVSFFLL